MVSSCKGVHVRTTTTTTTITTTTATTTTPKGSVHHTFWQRRTVRYTGATPTHVIIDLKRVVEYASF